MMHNVYSWLLGCRLRVHLAQLQLISSCKAAQLHWKRNASPQHDTVVTLGLIALQPGNLASNGEEATEAGMMCMMRSELMHHMISRQHAASQLFAGTLHQIVHTFSAASVHVLEAMQNSERSPVSIQCCRSLRISPRITGHTSPAGVDKGGMVVAAAAAAAHHAGVLGQNLAAEHGLHEAVGEDLHRLLPAPLLVSLRQQGGDVRHHLHPPPRRASIACVAPVWQIFAQDIMATA